MLQTYNLPEDGISSHFRVGNVFEDKNWADLDIRFDVIVTRRFLSIFEPRHKAVDALLSYCSPKGILAFELLAAESCKPSSIWREHNAVRSATGPEPPYKTDRSEAG